MPNEFVVGFRDFDNDKQEVSYPVGSGALLTDLPSFVAALELWTLAASGGNGFYDDNAADPGNAATSPLAQNSLQAIMEMRDITTGRTYIKRLPMPDMSKGNDGLDNAYTSSGNLTVFNPAHADYDVLKAEMETHVISPAGNAMTLTRIYIEE